MILLRSLLFTCLFFFMTALLCLLGLPFLLAGWRQNNDLGALWARSILWLQRVICGASSLIEGRENLPPGPCVVAMKHQSTWDTLIAAQLFKRPAFVLKRELLRVPFFGWYLAKSRMIAVDRKAGAAALKAMVASAHERLAEGRTIVIYPEGTRRAPGDPPAYHPGVAALYLELGLPVVPIAVNSGHFWGRLALKKRPGQVRLRILPAIPAGLHRRDFMRQLQASIEEASAELYDLAHKRPEQR